MEDTIHVSSLDKGVFFDRSSKVALLMNERDEWGLPGGSIEIGENSMQCLEREMREELALEIKAKILLDTYLFEVVPGKYVFIATYGCELCGPFNLSISIEHKRVSLFVSTALPENLPEGYRQSIFSWYSR